MSESTLLDLELLLGPLSDDSAAAATETSLQRLKDAFDEAQALVKEAEDKERMGGQDATGQTWRVVPPPDWETVIELSTAYLLTSRDLRAAAWLLAGLLGKHQLQGLAAGIDLCIGMCESYWAEIQPPANEESGHSDTTSGLRNVLSRKSFSSLAGVVLVNGTLETSAVRLAIPIWITDVRWITSACPAKNKSRSWRRAISVQRCFGQQLSSRRLSSLGPICR